MAAKRAIHIDAEARTVTETTVDTLEDLQKLVGGWIEFACELPSDDVVFVNEEGLLGEPKHFFYIDGSPQPYAGSGVVLGPCDGDGEETAATSDVDELRSRVTFLDPGSAYILAKMKGV